jgi:3-deoxy-D-manno-octulosonate 8-phosphate phosphatase (KDO 8-P phosphatase)
MHMGGDARPIRLLLLDVDGVLTDGTIVLHHDGTESKRFHIRDGAAIVWAQRAGLRIGLLSARTSEATVQRAAQLGIPIVVQGASDKLAAYEQIVRDTSLADKEIAYMGDDLQDLPVLERVGFSAAPADAAQEVRDTVTWVSSRDGGQGAVRELIEHLLRAQGVWERFVTAYQVERGPG